jgi:hypothetical protein
MTNKNAILFTYTYLKKRWICVDCYLFFCMCDGIESSSLFLACFIYILSSYEYTTTQKKVNKISKYLKNQIFEHIAFYFLIKKILSCMCLV